MAILATRFFPSVDRNWTHVFIKHFCWVLKVLAKFTFNLPQFCPEITWKMTIEKKHDPCIYQKLGLKRGHSVLWKFNPFSRHIPNTSCRTDNHPHPLRAWQHHHVHHHQSVEKVKMTSKPPTALIRLIEKVSIFSFIGSSHHVGTLFEQECNFPFCVS